MSVKIHESVPSNSAFTTEMMIRHLLILLALIAISLQAQAGPPRVAIFGDSITHDGRWATRVEAALRSTPEFAKAEIVNFGLGSETVSGLSEPNHAGGKFPRPCLHERLDRILDAYKPTLVLACYGMNDGIFLPLDESRLKAYQDGILKLKTAVEKQGGKIIFVTAPLYSADKPSDDPARYDAVIDAYGDWLVSRRADGWQVINIRPDLKQAVAAEKSRNPAFIYAKDNIHPGEEGHRFVADSIIRQLWPLLQLPGAPRLPDDDALAILRRRSDLLKLAWLTKTRHTRPGVPAGLPLDQAEARAAERMKAYLERVPAVSAGSGRAD
jgi:lysophospholipase L1-like esterase